MTKFCEVNYSSSKNDLATVFIERMLNNAFYQGTICTVMPQNWLFLSTYKSLRINILNNQSINFIIWLGEKSFSTPLGVSPILISINKIKNKESRDFFQIDSSSNPTINELKTKIKNGELTIVNQKTQLNNPDSRIVN